VTTEPSDSLRARIVAEYAKGYSIDMARRVLMVRDRDVRAALAEHPEIKRRSGRETGRPYTAVYENHGCPPKPIREFSAERVAELYGDQHYTDDPQACKAEPRFHGVPAQHG
jgi:hypothetical protein